MKTIIIKLCSCGKTLKGKQRKYCSRLCHNKSGNKKFQDYEAQKKRGKRRKLKLIKNKGGQCQKCSYKNNYASLCFHHEDPSTKVFGIDFRQCSNRSWKALLLEAEKCELLCSNCHMEYHHPDCLL